MGEAGGNCQLRLVRIRLKTPTAVLPANAALKRPDRNAARAIGILIQSVQSKYISWLNRSSRMTTVRGKTIVLTRHAAQGMLQERPPVTIDEVVRALESPDHDTLAGLHAWTGKRTILIRYTEYHDEIRIRSISATRRRLPP